MDLGLEVKAFREARYGCSSLGGRVRVDRIGRDCIHVHGNISSSRVLVHGMVIYHFGECGLSLSLGLRPMKTHSSNQEMKSN